MSIMIERYEVRYSPLEYEGVVGRMGGGSWGWGGRCRREVDLGMGWREQEEGFQGLSLHRWNVGRRFPPPLQGLPDRQCPLPHPGHFPADVDLQAGIRRRREAVRGAEVPLRAPPSHLQARTQQWGRGRKREGRGFPRLGLPKFRSKSPNPPPPHRPFLFPAPLVLLDCDVSGLKGVKMF